MSELEELKQLLANPNIEPGMAEVLRIRIAAFETVLNEQHRTVPAAPQSAKARQEP